MLALPVRSATLHGEGVICGPDGKSDFDRMRACFSRNGAAGGDRFAFLLTPAFATAFTRPLPRNPPRC
jgi:hypothetical protein